VPQEFEVTLANEVAGEKIGLAGEP
jgi:hypothetical protein